MYASMYVWMYAYTAASASGTKGPDRRLQVKQEGLDSWENPRVLGPAVGLNDCQWFGPIVLLCL